MDNNTEKVLLAKDIMKTNVYSVSPDTTIKEVARIMIEKGVSAVPVVSKFDEVLGVVSEADLIYKIVKPNEPGIMTFLAHAMLKSKDEVLEYRKAVARWNAQTAEEAMTSPALCVDMNEPVAQVAEKLMGNRVKRVIVAENGHLAGIISRADFVKLIFNEE